MHIIRHQLLGNEPIGPISNFHSAIFETPKWYFIIKLHVCCGTGVSIEISCYSCLVSYRNAFILHRKKIYSIEILARWDFLLYFQECTFKCCGTKRKTKVTERRTLNSPNVPEEGEVKTKNTKDKPDLFLQCYLKVIDFV